MQTAYDYIARGWAVFPLKPRSKEPATAHGFKDASKDPALVHRWWTANPRANVGIATGAASGLVVVDVDGPEGEAEWTTLQAQFGQAPTRASITGRGRHLLYAWPGAPIGNRSPFQHIHIRGDGGYIVAPPSIHPDTGTAYHWEDESVDIAPMPLWLLELLMGERNLAPSPSRPSKPIDSSTSHKDATPGNVPTYVRRAIEGETARVRGAGEGSRNDTLNRATFALSAFVRDGLVDEATVTAELRAAALAAGLEEHETEKTIESALRAGIAGSRRQINIQTRPAAAPSANGNGSNGNGSGHEGEAGGQGEGAKPAAPAKVKAIKPTDDDLAEEWMNAHPDTAFGMGEFRRYKEGVWAVLPLGQAESEITAVLRNAKVREVRPSAHLLASVRKLASVMISVPDPKWDNDFDVLVCKNGTLHIPTMTLRAHSQDDYQTTGLDYDFDPDADCPTFRYVLDSRIPDAAHLVQEFAGLALTTDQRYEIALWFYGPAGSGKSTIIEGFQTMLGKRAGLLGLADIESNRFALSDLPGKTLVVSTEQPAGFMASSYIVNRIISGEAISVDRKFRDAVTVIPRAKVLWAMNDLPRISDSADGILRRVQVVEFPPSLAVKDPAIKEGIKAEGPGILNWALEGLARLRARGWFEIPECVKSANQEYKQRNDIPAIFIDEMCDRGPDYRAGAEALYQAYKSWCETSGHKPMSSTSAANEWKRLGFEKAILNGRRHYVGVQLKPQEWRE